MVFTSVSEYLVFLGAPGAHVVDSILVANNGMSAVKFIRSIRNWSNATFHKPDIIKIVVMATPDDIAANAEYIRMADRVCRVSGGSNNVNYANVDIIVATALAQKVSAVWPGWGHASENPRLPNMLNAVGIVFIGPPGGPMYALGDKIGSTLIAQTAGVPTIAWNGDGIKTAGGGDIPKELYNKACIHSLEEARAVTERLGVPVMIKASEGGGGKGIRRVEKLSDVESAFRQVQNEVPGSPIFIMRLSPASRHLEVQLLADKYGQAVALSGRDCSIQRRHQKIIEEGPPLAPTADTWKEMEAAAVRLALEVGYENAGTIEYLLNENGEFFFLELNPRLQVEHPVTEMITGVNMPAAQLQIAFGVPLHRIPDIRRYFGEEDLFGCSPIQDEKKRTRGHCVAARITAENPYNGFKPTVGKLLEVTLRSWQNVWGYFAVDSSGKVGEYSDSQIGHVFAWGSSREDARISLSNALRDLTIRGDGLRTSTEYLFTLLEDPEFIDNKKINTTWLDERLLKNKNHPITAVQRYNALRAAAACLAHQKIEANDQEIHQLIQRGHTPESALFKREFSHFSLVYENIKYILQITRLTRSVFRVTCRGSSTDIEVTKMADGGYMLIDVRSLDSSMVYSLKQDLVDERRFEVDGKTFIFSTGEDDPSKMRVPSGGKFIRYLVDNKSTVTAGMPYAEVEVMKMTMQLSAMASGRVTLMNKQEGSKVDAGEILGTLELTSFVSAAEECVDPGIFDVFHVDSVVVQQGYTRLKAFLSGEGVLLSDWRMELDTLISQTIRIPEQWKRDELMKQFNATRNKFKVDILALEEAINNNDYKSISTICSNGLPAETAMLQTLSVESDSLLRALANQRTPLSRYDALQAEYVGDVKSKDALLRAVQDALGESKRLETIFQPPSVSSCYDYLDMISKEGEIIEYAELDDKTNVWISNRERGKNTVGMVAWRIRMRTKQYPKDGRIFVVIVNDIFNSAGSFGTSEDEYFLRASKYARTHGYPRLFIAANSGARIGLANEVKSVFKVQWIDDQDPAKGYIYIYLDADDYETLSSSVVAEPVGDGRWKINAIIGTDPDLGVENLRGSGMIAGETSRAYNESFTLSYVSNRSVGIGAYLVRLGRRVIQKRTDAPLLLTGYQALNSLVGAQVYTSNDQIGGPDVMYLNGVSHLTVDTDREGVHEMMRWLSYVPDVFRGKLPVVHDGDLPNRSVTVDPLKASDPRLLFSGEGGFFDNGSFKEYMAGWARTVITARARLGGIPVGVVCPELRTVQCNIPADPADKTTSSRTINQAGQVWYPDSSFKTAQAIEDMNREGLPLIIFANWRGFSGGKRDMHDQVLKFGAQIVDALVAYKQPVFVYIMPYGELRGGAWVVLDSSINPEHMEMYASNDARGGVLEPSGTVNIKFRKSDMDGLSKRTCAASHDALQDVALHFADLHDRPERMLATGVIRDIVLWEESRMYFYNRLKYKTNN